MGGRSENRDEVPAAVVLAAIRKVNNQKCQALLARMDSESGGRRIQSRPTIDPVERSKTMTLSAAPRGGQRDGWLGDRVAGLPSRSLILSRITSRAVYPLSVHASVWLCAHDLRSASALSISWRIASLRDTFCCLAKRSISSTISLEKRAPVNGRIPVVAGRPGRRFATFFAIDLSYS
jgi:hypothetical protein